MAFRTFQPRTSGQPLPYYGADDLTITDVLLAPFSFSGRASRLGYLIMLAVSLGLNIALGLIAYKVLGDDLKAEHPPAIFAIFIPAVIGLYWYQLATFVRRLRDRGWPNVAIIIISVALPALIIVPYAKIMAVLGCLWFFIECAFLPSAD